MKKSILDIKEVTVLNKNQQSLLSGGSNHNCYPSSNGDTYDECYWE